MKITGTPIWQRDFPGSVALAVGREALAIANGSRLAVLSLESGKELWGHNLDAAPVPWGLAVDAEGRIVLALVDGQLLCMATP